MSTYRQLLDGQSTLVCLLQGMEGVRTRIELRTEDTVDGVIESVDPSMKYAPHRST